MKNRVLKFIFFGIICTMLLSCTVKQKVSFKKDFSGKYAYDFSEYLKYIGADQSFGMENSDFEKYLKNTKEFLSNQQGISNVNVKGDVKKGIIGFSFTFKDIEALNTAIKYIVDEEEKPLENTSHFVLEKNKLIYTRYPILLDGKEEIIDNDMYDMIKCEFTIQFKNKVKSYDIQNNPNVQVSKNNKIFVERASLEDVLLNEVKWVFDFK